MNTVEAFTIGNSEAILDRHAFRRKTGIPTVSLLVGPMGASGRAWRRWAATTARSVVLAQGDSFPSAQWIQAVAEQIDIPKAALHRLAFRCERDPDQFAAEWRDKTPADQERFWNTYSRNQEDDLLLDVVRLVAEFDSPGTTISGSNDPNERLVPTIVQLTPSAILPSVLFVFNPTDDLTAIGKTAAKWAVRVPALPIAIAVPENTWDLFVDTAPDSQVKALLREGLLRVPVMEPAALYFHFVDPASYRRDRLKDWELQRRGFLVLRFLADDVISKIDTIRDRILDALVTVATGETL